MYDDGYDDDRYGDFLCSLAEGGRAHCDTHQEEYDLSDDGSDPGCPRCLRVAEMREQIQAGALDASMLCYACGECEAETSVLDRSVCHQCHQALARGEHRLDRLQFACLGGNSALRAAGPGNPRSLPCPTCGEPNRLTPQDRARGYQCDSCADQAEQGW